MLSRRAALIFGIADLLTAALVTLAVFVALPARWAPVDVTAVLLAALKLGSGVSLVARTRLAPWVATAAAGFALAVGLVLVTVLALTASWLSGVYGPVGQGGSLLMVFSAALALPYLVVLPAVQLFWLRAKPSSAE